MFTTYLNNAMKKIGLIAITLIGILSKTNACLNLFAIDSSGKVNYLEHHFFLDIRFQQQAIHKNLLSLQRQFKKGKFDYRNISDYAAYLLMDGRFEEGLTLCRALAAKKGDVYQIRANLAVAYELNGMIDSAWHWQQQALALNPGAHGGSEWVHLRILAARKAMLTNPNWCLTNNITGIQDSIALNYRMQEHEGEGMFIFESFLLQLEERLPFTKGPDPVMGKLLFELAEAYKQVSLYRAYYCYVLAGQLYPDLAPDCRTRQAFIEAKYPINEIQSKGLNPDPDSQFDKDREKYPPTEAGAMRFAFAILHRPHIKKSTITTMPLVAIIDKIQ